jgi:transcriptional regulator with GAF, ATPase, and Fis domain
MRGFEDAKTTPFLDLATDAAGKPIAEKKRQIIEIISHLASNNEMPYIILFYELPTLELLQTFIGRNQLGNSMLQDAICIVISSRISDRPTSWKLMQYGVRDIYYFEEAHDLVEYMKSGISRRKKVKDLLNSPLIKNNLIGDSKIWQHFLASVVEVALFSQSSVLFTGETGTGKELISRLIHAVDDRENKKDLVLLDCTTIVKDLSGSEFFGHERGAYTNAVQAREGAFSMANNGTLFLDEVGDLPLGLQAELLRVIQEGTYKKVGSNSWQKTSFRLVCATHRNIREQVASNLFRQDLFFRISDFEFHVPALKDRREDIPLLANYFLGQFITTRPLPEFDDSVMEYLLRRPYDGNIRELRQVIRRIALRHTNHKKITIGEIPSEDRPIMGEPIRSLSIQQPEPLKSAIISGASIWDLKEKTMRDAITAALEITNGNKKLAAEKLGLTLRAVQQFLKNQKAVN